MLYVYRFLSVILILGIVVFAPFTASAQRNVVVVPLIQDAPQIPQSPSAWGQIRSDASIRNSSPNVTGVLHPSTGMYCILFETEIEQNRLESAVVTSGADGPLIGSIGNGVGGLEGCTENNTGIPGLEVIIYDLTGTLIDRRFTFIVP